MSKFSDYLYATFSITLSLDTITSDVKGQALMASILVLAAQSDGSVSPVESAKLASLLNDKFANSDDESIQLAVESAKRISDLSRRRVLIKAANQDLALPHKEDLMVMVLQIIAADERKEPGELELLDELMDGLDIPANVMDRVYSRYFKGKHRNAT